MRPQLIMFMYGTFIIGTILSVIISGRWLGADETDVINQLAGFSLVRIEALGGWGIPKSIASFFSAVVTVLSWNYPYLESSWGTIFKYVFLYPITVGVIITLVELASSVVQGVAGTVKSLLPG